MQLRHLRTKPFCFSLSGSALAKDCSDFGLMKSVGVRSMLMLQLGVRANPSAVYQVDRHLSLCRSVKKSQEYPHPAFCIRRLLDNSSKSVKWSAVNTDLLTDSQVRPSTNEPFCVCLFHQIINNIAVNRRRYP